MNTSRHRHAFPGRIRRSGLHLTWSLGLALLFMMPVAAWSAVIMGVVRQAPGANPVVGARIEAGGQFTYSAAGGVYSLSLAQGGTYTIVCSKPGFITFTSAPVYIAQAATFVQDLNLQEELNAPAFVAAANDTVLHHVRLDWPEPAGPYNIIYDDGIQENFTVWGTQGNMNAVKFVPAGYPAKIKGGMVHIGSAANYQPGSNPLVPFQVMVCDASGPGGTPGNSLAGPFTVTPQDFGWVSFEFPAAATIYTGAFYLVMIQGGAAPNAAGLAIDETTPQFRSYAKFVAGGGPWYPAGGNFMIRALCHGPGGPMLLADAPTARASFDLFRLRQGEELNPAAWTLLTNTVSNAFADNAWPLLPCSPYRWAVITRYPGNRAAPVVFSNVIGKCWTTPVSLLIQSSCTAAGKKGSFVTLRNQALPDTLYQAVTDTSGEVNFASVWKGSYQLTVSRFGYDSVLQTLPVMSPVSLTLPVWQHKSPPRNLTVGDSSLMARWDVPGFERMLLCETWSTGTTTTNHWSVTGGTNWGISQATGNPLPSAAFSGSPQISGYSQSLITPTIAGQHSTLLKLNYDVFLDNTGTTSLNQMAVEIWDGSAWNLLKNYTNSGGDIAWSAEEFDISSYTDADFRIRFRACGENSADINNWNLDNVMVTASEPPQELSKCILGYYFYLGNMITGYTNKNVYFIPPELVQYGQSYQACVRALYESGYSETACTTFVSHFLYPVRNIRGQALEDAAFVEWDKPEMISGGSGATPPGLAGYRIYRNQDLVATIADPDSLSFYDLNLDPGKYLYGVAALYDLTPYGFPGTTGESEPAGPLNITIDYGLEIPFTESWTYGSFSYFNWRFAPSRGNWTIATDQGNPAPAAIFSGQPSRENYSFALESATLNALDFDCATIWFDFDVSLNSLNNSGTEKMIAEVFYSDDWHQVATIVNNTSFSWTRYHLDISNVAGKGFRIRFRSEGKHSTDIVNWRIDNISIYPVCYPAMDLDAELPGNQVILSWSPPVCHGGATLSEGFENDLFPPALWTLHSTNPSATWIHQPAASLPGVHSGNFSASLDWDYSHQDEWIIAHDVYINGNLRFWSYAFQGSLHQDHYYVKISEDQGATWTVLMDLSAMPPYPGASGINAWETPYNVDLGGYQGKTVDIAWQAVDSDGNGLWYPWAIDDCSVGLTDAPVLPGNALSGLLGYDIFRRQEGANTFDKINEITVTDTSFTDSGVTTATYRYFVTSRFENCTYATNSDTITVGVITGISDDRAAAVTIFPNPATNRLQITADEPIGTVMISNLTGSVLNVWDGAANRSVTLTLPDLPSGIYLLQLRIAGNLVVKKICIAAG